MVGAAAGGCGVGGSVRVRLQKLITNKTGCNCVTPVGSEINLVTGFISRDLNTWKE